MDKKILTIIDWTNRDEHPVVERVGWLAKRTSAAVELFICDFDTYIDTGHVATLWMPTPGAKENLLAIHRDNLEQLAEPLRARGIEVAVDVAWDHPLGEALARKIVKSRPWVVAKDTHYHNLLKRTILSNTDWHLIRVCPAPLLLVKPHRMGNKPKVVAAVDPLHPRADASQLDGEIYRHARALAEDTGGVLHVVNCFSMPMDLQMPPNSAKRIKQQHHAAMVEFFESHPVRDGHAHLLRGRPEECLVEFAEREGAAFVVMGAVSRRGLSNLFIGSTAERTLDRMPCDVLIVKPV